jgi:hypothetical protein
MKKEFKNRAEKCLEIMTEGNPSYEDLFEMFDRFNRILHKKIKRLITIDDDADFYSVYDNLAKKGKTDSAGGMEYNRVHSAWVQAGRPLKMKKFILEHV